MPEIDARFLIFETDHWQINHRLDSALPGYLMVGAKANGDFHRLPAQALIELGPLLARAEKAIHDVLKPKRSYIGRYGHSAGWPLHFHILPIHDWLERQFWADERYRALATFGLPERADSTDGAELTLFVWREFCERLNPPPVEGPSVDGTIDNLRRAFAQA